MTNKTKQQQNSSLSRSTTETSSKKKKVVKPQKGNPLWSVSRDEQQYLKGVINPFKYGADNRIPSAFPFPTQTFHSCWSATIQTDPSGNFYFILLPSPTISVLLGNSSASLTVQNGIYAFTNVLAPINDANLAAKGDSIRMVDCGWLFSNNANFSNIAGTITFTPFICPDAGLSQAQAAQGTSSGVLTFMAGTATSSLSAPGAFQVDADELIDQEVLITTRPVGPNANDWRTTGNNPSIGNSWNVVSGDFSVLEGNASGLGSTASGTSAGNCKGLVGWIVSGNGFPVSSPAVNIRCRMDMEIASNGSVSTNNNLLTSSSKAVQSTSSFEALASHLGGYENLSALVKPFVDNGLQVAARRLPGFLAGLLI